MGQNLRSPTLAAWWDELPSLRYIPLNLLRAPISGIIIMDLAWVRAQAKNLLEERTKNFWR